MTTTERAALGADLLFALERILAEPHGCPFCDSGKLRGPKPHSTDCGFALAHAALADREDPGDESGQHHRNGGDLG